MNFKIYLPDEISSENCPVVLNNYTIRVYDNIPVANSSSTFTDYYINSHYLVKVGSESFESVIPVCLDSSNFTTDYYYRNDFPSILFIFLILLIVCFYIPFRCMTRFIRRWN